jgi:hypothetical protein
MISHGESTITASGDVTPPALGAQLSRLIFVGGSPRSGTTLIQRILDCHPEIYGGPEFDFVPSIVDLFQNMRNSIRSGRIDAFLNEKGLAHAFRSFLIALLSPKLQAEEVSYLSEKTPSNVLAFPWLEECVPESKKILVLRDPRDVIDSMLEVGRRERRRTGRASGFVRDMVAAVDYMNQCLEAGVAVTESSPNSLVVYYEDVVLHPLGVANRMYRFIGVPEIANLDLENEQFKAARNQESWIDWATPGTMSGGVQNDRVGVAAHRLSRAQLDYINAKTIRHPLLAERYSMPLPRWTAAARWCKARCVASRVRERAPALWLFLRERLMG